MSLDNTSNETTQQIKEFLKQGKKMKLDIQDLQEALKDLSKSIGENIQVKPALLMKALNVAFKNSAEDVREDFTTVEEILAIAGEI